MTRRPSWDRLLPSRRVSQPLKTHKRAVTGCKLVTVVATCIVTQIEGKSVVLVTVRNSEFRRNKFRNPVLEQVSVTEV